MGLAQKSILDNEKIVIKKYANRRLYNTDSSCYVTLDDLAVMVRKNIEFVVRDAKSEKDITHCILKQIIFDEEIKRETLLSLNFLRQLITLYGEGLQEIVPAYLENSLADFAKDKDKLRQDFKDRAREAELPSSSSLSLFSPVSVRRGAD